MESVFQVWKMLFATSVFLVFFVWDLVMAFQRRDPWIQGSALTLTALTVQFLGYFDVQNVDLFGKPREEELQTLLNKQLSLDVARLVFCTFLGCVLPSVAFHSFGGRWANIAALSVSLCLHMGTEVHALQNVHDPILRSGRGEDFIWSSVLLLVAAISLVLYLGLAVVNCKYSRDRLNFKIPTMLSGWVESKIEPDINENEVFKWWVVVRACHQEFWLRSSAFTPAVLMIVTTCVAVVMGKLISRQSILRHSNTSVILTLCLQCAFIVTGWIILIWRWLILLLLCTSHEGPLDSFVSNISVCAKCFSRLVKLIIKNLMTLDKVSPYKYIPTCVWKALRILVFFIYVMILLLKYLLFLVFFFPLFFNYMCWFLWIGLLLCLVRVRRFIVCVRDFRSKADERLKSPGTEETIYVPVSSVNETRKAKDEAFLEGKGYYENLKSMKCLVLEYLIRWLSCP